MAPVKFDDLAKPANEVLNDDYQTSGYQLKAKQKTNWDGAVVTTSVDLFPGKDPVQTPAKVTLKLPKPFGCSGLSVDKLEVDKAGNIKLETVVAHKVPELKVEVKSDLVDWSKATAGLTYSGIKNTQVKFETRPSSFQQGTLEVTREVCDYATVGLKFAGLGSLGTPDLGARVTYNNVVAAVAVKERLQVVSAHGFFKASKDLKLAASYEHGGKRSGAMSLGLAFAASPSTSVKAKLQQDGAVSASVKHEVTKGFTLLAGGKLDLQGGKHSYGLQLSIE